MLQTVWLCLLGWRQTFSPPRVIHQNSFDEDSTSSSPAFFSIVSRPSRLQDRFLAPYSNTNRRRNCFAVYSSIVYNSAIPPTLWDDPLTVIVLFIIIWSIKVYYLLLLLLSQRDEDRTKLLQASCAHLDSLPLRRSQRVMKFLELTIRENQHHLPSRWSSEVKRDRPRSLCTLCSSRRPSRSFGTSAFAKRWPRCSLIGCLRYFARVRPFSVPLRFRRFFSWPFALLAIVMLLRTSAPPYRPSFSINRNVLLGSRFKTWRLVRCIKCVSFN